MQFSLDSPFPWPGFTYFPVRGFPLLRRRTSFAWSSVERNLDRLAFFRRQFYPALHAALYFGLLVISLPQETLQSLEENTRPRIPRAARMLRRSWRLALPTERPWHGHLERLHDGGTLGFSEEILLHRATVEAVKILEGVIGTEQGVGLHFHRDTTHAAQRRDVGPGEKKFNQKKTRKYLEV